ncbi:MAG: hypothetical protein HZC48_07625 [Nitrospirae bacterium]|nr:hypothetical protein [Nitrospirota bacterium]
MQKKDIKDILGSGMTPLLIKMESRRLEKLLTEFFAWFDRLGKYSRGGAEEPEKEIINFLLFYIDEKVKHISKIRLLHAEFNKGISKIIAEDERRKYILDYAADFGASARQLKGDSRAFKRWFGHDAITDRYIGALKETERDIAFGLDRLGVIAALFIERQGPVVGYQQLWRQFNIERAVKPLLAYGGDNRVRIAAFKCLAAILWSMPDEFQEHIVEDSVMQYIYLSALDSRQEVWIQCEALVLLDSLSSSSLIKTLQKRLSNPLKGNDFFVRKTAVHLLGRNLKHLPELLELIPVVANDPSAFVRQALPQALIEAPDEYISEWLFHLSRNDSMHQVRAAALLEIENILSSRGMFEDMLKIMTEALRHERDEFVLRTALRCAVRTTTVNIKSGDEGLAAKWHDAMHSEIERLHTDAESLAVRRWAALAREQIWAEYNRDARTIKEILLKEMAEIKPGKQKRLPGQLLSDFNLETIARTLSVLCQEDYGCQIGQDIVGKYIARGNFFHFRLWRFLHEFRHPSPDKRQAFSHTIGRIFTGNIHVPSSIMAELTETKVPGEPLFMPYESGWRPYLPLADEVVSSLRYGLSPGAVKIFTSEGVTEITPPKLISKRLLAYMKLTWNFPHYARLRNWQEGSQSSPSTYIRALTDLGFTIKHSEHEADNIKTSPDPSVKRFFPLLAFIDPNTWADMKDYFFSVYKNSLYELGIFTGIIILAFVLSILLQSRMIRRIRDSFPLMLGGWGTRGKSGVERLKAALINSMGYSLVSKTTGCEAMFLHARHYEKTQEMFLFRPYDKATIWEQFNLMRLGRGLKADVFLWECMGLTPSYVKILQRKWGRDDISTITNTYPDHEDLQGPAGINIPEVISNFIPESGTVLCSEDQMRPVLVEAAKRLKTDIRFVGWLEAGMLTPEVLERFPYQEHPYNIALVLSLAEELGMEKDFAIKEMADRVIPDIGVLKAFPIASVKSRRLEFVNGMSANERYGFLSNWQRMGFKEHDYEEDPGVWLSTVVNNRADRVTRSRLFAKIVVEDANADRHFLIGSNLKGLTGYIQEAWQDYIAQISLWPDTGETPPPPAEILKQSARRLRIPISEAQVIKRLSEMLKGLKVDTEKSDLLSLWNSPEKLKERLDAEGLEKQSEDIIKHLKEYASLYEEYRGFSERLSGAGLQKEGLDKEFREMMWRWFEKKIVVIWDFHASGDKIVSIIAQETPPGLLNRVMGIQNIKGTGLDFVYRWQAWEKCFSYCAKLPSNDPREFEEGLSDLSVFQEYGVLCEDHVREKVEIAKAAPLSQNEKAQAELAVVLSNLEGAMTWVRSKMETQRKAGFLITIVDAIEAFLDIGDAVKRRKTADRIYKDMITERISHERAIIQLKELNKRQKGGWFWAQFTELKNLLIRKPAGKK